MSAIRSAISCGVKLLINVATYRPDESNCAIIFTSLAPSQKKELARLKEWGYKVIKKHRGRIYLTKEK